MSRGTACAGVDLETNSSAPPNEVVMAIDGLGACERNGVRAVVHWEGLGKRPAIVEGVAALPAWCKTFCAWLTRTPMLYFYFSQLY